MMLYWLVNSRNCTSLSSSENFVLLRSTIADASNGNGNFFSDDTGAFILCVFLQHFAAFFVG
uniref:Uncharacterized protein n=1 Tax=Arundo donax TaxID=35708 RepID=A0A0A9BT31_ARUDO